MQSGNLITLQPGESAVCGIVNNDIPPQLTLVKQVINDRTDGTALYVVGESRSFTNAGNAVGQNDVMILRYVPAP